MSLASRRAAIPTKKVVIEYKEVKVPSNSVDTLTRFAANSSTKASTANEWTIDVFPSQIPVSAYLMKLASAASAKADHKNESKSSLATFCLYYQCVYHAFFLLNDLHVRPSPSGHAQSWSNIAYKNKFAEWLLSLPVPEEMEPLFAQLSATQTEKTKNVFYVPSAAGFDAHLFHGRYVPLNFFAHIHDCMATMPGNSKPGEIYADLLPRLLFKYDFSSAKKESSVADLLGFFINATTATTANYAATKWFQVFTAIFNPVLFRDFHRRSSLAPLDFTVPEFKTKSKFNAYDVLFSATPHNLRELRVVLEHVMSVLDGVVSIKRSLSEVIAAGSGINITMHGYSTYALPTWSSLTTANRTSLSAVTKVAAEATEARASDLMFLQVPTRTADTDVSPVSGTGASTVSAVKPWSLIHTGTATQFPEDKDFVQFADDTHCYPRVLVLDPVGDLKLSAHLATLTGKIIESFEIDGTVISFPNVNLPLGMQNCQFFDSAIPYAYVARATLAFRDGYKDITPIHRRLPKASTSLPAASLLHDRNTISLPAVATQTTSAPVKAKIVDDPAPTVFPGLTEHYSVWIKYVQSFLGFRSKINDDTNDADTIPGMQKGRLLVWSPYSYTSYEDDSCEDTIPDSTKTRSYFITNFRSVFGTDAPLYELVHPMEAIPI